MGRQRYNQWVTMVNQRIGQILASATGQNLPPSPESWWAWWDKENGVAMIGEKYADVRYNRDVQVYQDVIPTDEPGYYGIHKENSLITRNYRMQCQARVARYATEGDSLGLNVNDGPWKQHLVLRSDGVYAAVAPGQMRRITQMVMDHQWHVWDNGPR